ncbi:predicted protein [Naegleria gruberi]|uniref:Predicted protein n=1 Tax=Naegleria gruberi TaxID=5762 RepID=D2V6E1_NAEGR|nr:uncharacterized protein NAEGRDRAFT_64403 [Naegleria gruberi]EFC47432.1 predicted protein [Naegleria gruberi]|eukprot:XP_002680176.1 predicted protein [Naegleria gruberi strain NEG-M]
MNLRKPFKLVSTTWEEEFNTNQTYYKMSVKISGIDSPLIVRWSTISSNFGLFEYNYSKLFYYYFAMEKDDLLNENEFFVKEMNSADFENLGKSNRAFLFKFNGKANPGSVYGKEYLVREILDYLVPTVNSYQMSPMNFIPYWCFLFDLIMYSNDYHKELYKHYPAMISHPSVYKFFYLKYQPRVVTITKSALNQFSTYKPGNETETKLFKSITENHVESINFESENREQLMTGIQGLYKIIVSRPSKFFPPLPLAKTIQYDEKEEFEIKASYLASVYKMCKYMDEHMDWYLGSKLRKSYQIDLSNK